MLIPDERFHQPLEAKEPKVGMGQRQACARPLDERLIGRAFGIDALPLLLCEA